MKGSSVVEYTLSDYGSCYMISTSDPTVFHFFMNDVKTEEDTFLATQRALSQIQNKKGVANSEIYVPCISKAQRVNWEWGGLTGQQDISLKFEFPNPIQPIEKVNGKVFDGDFILGIYHKQIFSELEIPLFACKLSKDDWIRQLKQEEQTAQGLYDALILEFCTQAYNQEVKELSIARDI